MTFIDHRNGCLWLIGQKDPGQKNLSWLKAMIHSLSKIPKVTKESTRSVSLILKWMRTRTRKILISRFKGIYQKREVKEALIPINQKEIILIVKDSKIMRSINKRMHKKQQVLTVFHQVIWYSLWWTSSIKSTILIKRRLRWIMKWMHHRLIKNNWPRLSFNQLIRSINRCKHNRSGGLRN